MITIRQPFIVCEFCGNEYVPDIPKDIKCFTDGDQLYASCHECGHKAIIDIDMKQYRGTYKWRNEPDD